MSVTYPQSFIPLNAVGSPADTFFSPLPIVSPLNDNQPNSTPADVPTNIMGEQIPMATYLGTLSPGYAPLQDAQVTPSGTLDVLGHPIANAQSTLPAPTSQSFPQFSYSSTGYTTAYVTNLL